MATLKELIEKHGPLPIKVRATTWQKDNFIQVFFIDDEGKAVGLNNCGFPDCFYHSEKVSYELYIEPPKPIVFECEWKDSNLIHPFREDIRVILNPIVGKKTRVTVEVLGE